MLRVRYSTGFAMIAVLGLGACADKGLRTLQHTGNGPDEFLVTPSKPLEAPQDYSFLPAPTPGGTNRTDQFPTQDAVASVGGNPARLDPNGPVPGADAALVTAASRNGVDPNVRETLAETDAKFRKRQSRLSGFRLFRVDRYEQAYRREALDPYQAAVPARRAGLPTPSSPPYDQ
ncbi:MAG: DUF3035 domain-containing protein [Paracoccaceae bacterium]